MRWVVLWGVVALASPCWSAENEGHQRVAAEEKRDHRWSAEVGLGFVPAGASGWSLDLSPRLEYEYVRSWTGSVSFPLGWFENGTTGPLLRSGEISLDLGWHSTEEPRWRWGLSIGGEVVRRPSSPWMVTGEVGTSWVLDPSVLGLGFQIGVPWGVDPQTAETPWVASLGFSVQEVLNDRIIQSFSLGPRWASVRGRTMWSLSLGFSVGWYPDHASLTVGGSTGTGQNWGLSGAGGVWW